ncbi:MAG TPA: hypothetical protein VK448_11015 [Dissulfurispiraceae bacterium]|nr:hypothetical protein [Dissulfurispiraceae bacterium]
MFGDAACLAVTLGLTCLTGMIGLKTANDAARWAFFVFAGRLAGLAAGFAKTVFLSSVLGCAAIGFACLFKAAFLTMPDFFAAEDLTTFGAGLAGGFRVAVLFGSAFLGLAVFLGLLIDTLAFLTAGLTAICFFVALVLSCWGLTVRVFADDNFLDAGFTTGIFLAEDFGLTFFATAFFAACFLETAFLTTVVLERGFFVAVFFATVLLAELFLSTDFPAVFI